MKKTSDAMPVETITRPNKPSSGAFFWPILLIIIGILLLLNNLEILPWTIWANLIRFWPIILILIGLEILLGRSKTSNTIITTLGLIVVLTILAINIPQLVFWAREDLNPSLFNNLQILFNPNQLK